MQPFHSFKTRSSHSEVFYKKGFLKVSQNSRENACARACNFIKKETLVQVFSCEFYKILKNTFFTEHLRTTAFVKSLIKYYLNFESFPKICLITFLISIGNFDEGITFREVKST